MDLFEYKNVDNKGKFLIYDIREDEEQISKMNEISELLVAGGYFRARIKGLHNFDKVLMMIILISEYYCFDLFDLFYSDYRWNLLGNPNVQC